MKNVRLLIFSLFALSVLGRAAPAAGEPDIVGKWQYSDGRGYTCVLSFNPNGTFDGHLGNKNEAHLAFAGTWKRKENRILYTYKRPQPAKDEDKIIALEPTFFIIQAQNGEQRRYERIKAEKGD